MGYSISVKAPRGLPYPHEPICSSGQCEGGIIGACVVLGYKKNITKFPDKTKIVILKKLIKEIDLEEKGEFNTAFWKKIDDKYGSQEQEWARTYMPADRYKPEEWAAQVWKQRLRKDCTRFLLYYLAGYKVTYQW